jgi:hypothetical protein
MNKEIESGFAGMCATEAFKFGVYELSSFSKNCSLQFDAFFLNYHRSTLYGQEYLFEQSETEGYSSELGFPMKTRHS